MFQKVNTDSENTRKQGFYTVFVTFMAWWLISVVLQCHYIQHILPVSWIIVHFFFSIVHSVNDIREDSVDAEMKKWSAGVSVFCRDVRSVRSLRALLLRCGTTKSDLHLTALLTVSKLPSLAFCVISWKIHRHTQEYTFPGSFPINSSEQGCPIIDSDELIRGGRSAPGVVAGCYYGCVGRWMGAITSRNWTFSVWAHAFVLVGSP